MESLKKCEDCDGTGDRFKRAEVAGPLKQQCPACRGEGMVVDIAPFVEALERGPGLLLRAVRETVDGTQLDSVVPDSSWVHRDKSRHIHRWSSGDEGEVFVQTCQYVVDAEATDEDPERGHLECKRCGDRVEPGYITRQDEQSNVVGLKEYFINDEQVGRRTFLAVLDLLRRTK